MKWLFYVALLGPLITSCAAKQAESDNQPTNSNVQPANTNPIGSPSAQTGNINTGNIPSYAITDGGNVNSTSADQYVRDALQQFEVVMLQFASTTCAGCQEEAEAINEIINNQGLNSRASHILVFTDIEDPNSLNGFKADALSRFKSNAQISDIKYMPSGLFDGTQKFWSYVVSRDGRTPVSFPHDHSDLAGRTRLVQDAFDAILDN